MANALNNMESNLAAKATRADLTAAVNSQAEAAADAADLAQADKIDLESKLNTTKDELEVAKGTINTTKHELELAKGTIEELKTLFTEFKTSTDEKMESLEAQLQLRARKREEQDAKNNIDPTAANNDDNSETRVVDNTTTNTNTNTNTDNDNDNETSASTAGKIAAITAPLLLIAVIVIGVLVHRNQKNSQNKAPRGRTRPRRASRARPSGRQPRQPRQQQQQFGGIQDPQEPYDSSFVSSSMRAVSNPTYGEAGELVHQNPAFDQNADENAYLQASTEQAAMYDHGEVPGLHESEENYESVDGEDSDDYQC